MAKAHKRADGTWYGAVYLGKNLYNEKDYKFVYAPKEKECNQKIREVEYKRDHGLLQERTKSNLVTVEDYWNEWLDGKVSLADSTIQEYKSVKKKHLSKVMKMNAKDLNYRVVQKLYNDIYKENNNNPKLVKKVSRSFNCFLRKMAVDRSCPIPRDVLDGIELPACPKVKHYKINTQTHDTIVKALKEEYDKEDSDIGYLYNIAMITSCGGCRIGEATAIFIDDIDFENNTIKINKQQLPVLGKGYCIVEKTKTEAGNRIIVITSSLKKFLLEHLEKQKIMIEELKMLGIEPQPITFIRADKTEEIIDSFNLLTTTNAGKLVKKNSAQRNWKKFREDLGYEEQIRIHDFRRYFATQMMKAGVPDTIAKSQLGHTDVDMTQYYQDDTEELKQEYLSKLDL